ncbi:MAG TPA: hypothetical protein VHX52_01895 [Steroidobacteraceae bacterium]|jgi:hypothetical protein|nr:hypothetical protein [Steroidobacteraceae bacterium]
MRWLTTIITEIFGLFVDDGSFALAILIWLGAVWLALVRLALPRGWGAIVLFAGLAVILIGSAVRRAGRR